MPPIPLYVVLSLFMPRRMRGLKINDGIEIYL